MSKHRFNACPGCGQRKLVESKSCRKCAGAKRLIHGRSAEYWSYKAMMSRCYNPNWHRYDRYGGRGIKVCDAWRGHYPVFLQDMGRRPTVKHTLERKNNDGDYCPENCRWATRKEQAQNTANTRLITHQGITRSMKAWSEHLKIPLKRLQGRLNLGWDFERAISTPQVQPYYGRPASHPCKL
jgi:hypothetical protein